MRLPDDTHRHVIVGSTGSGKSQNGAYHLSRRSFDRIPWYVFNPKRDELLDSCGMDDYDITGKLAKKPGLYNFSPVPGRDDEAVSAFLAKAVEAALEKGYSAGFYFDEGYSIPKRDGSFRAILTQGRSLRLPAIVLTQRPSWIDRFTWSEASFLQLFRLNTLEDKAIVRGWFPSRCNIMDDLPEFYSWYYDVARNDVAIAKPVPGADEISDAIRGRLKQIRQPVPIRRRIL